MQIQQPVHRQLNFIKLLIKVLFPNMHKHLCAPTLGWAGGVFLSQHRCKKSVTGMRTLQAGRRQFFFSPRHTIPCLCWKNKILKKENKNSPQNISVVFGPVMDKVTGSSPELALSCQSTSPSWKRKQSINTHPHYPHTAARIRSLPRSLSIASNKRRRYSVQK